ncbi:ATPase, F1 complex, gamma subunit protein [Capsicum annuum]|nr:ATPase, F1 complex, gamma subunit protein [Capsicum annuum]
MVLNLFGLKRRNLFIRAIHLGKHFSTPNTEEILFKSICVNLRERKWRFLDQLLPSLKDSVLPRVFHEFRSSPNVVLELYQRISASRSVLSSLETCCIVIHTMVNCKNYNDALFLMKELMISRGYSPLDILEVLLDTYDVSFPCDAVFDTLVRACTELGASDGAYGVIEKSRMEGFFVSVHAWNNFLNRLVKVDDVCRFWFFYKEMVSYGYSENVYTFNLVIYALCKECKLLEAICVFYKMLKSGIMPNVVTFNMLVDGACRIGKLDEALKLVRNVEIMSDGCVFSNIVTYNCLINGYCKLGDVAIGEQFLDEMIERGLEPNVRTYATLVDGYSRNGMLDEAFRICNAMVEKGLMPNSVVYNTIIHRLYVEGDVNEASSLLSDMIEKYISPDKFTHSILEKGLCRNGRINEALSYHKQIVENNLMEDAFSHNILVDYLCKSQNLLGALQLICSMFVRGLIPDLVTYGTMIDGYCKEGNINRAVEIYDDIIKVKKNPNLVIYNSILDGLCKEVSVDVAEVLVEELKGTSLYDVITYNTLLNGYCIGGKIDKALHLFLKMRKERISVNTVTYNILINFMCKLGLIQHAKELMSVMITHGIFPDCITYTTLITSISKESSAGEVVELHDYMEQITIKEQLVLDKAPSVTALYFKRFKTDGSLVEKIDKYVSFPLELDLHTYADNSQIDNVVRVQEDYVLSQEAYVLFYMKRGTPWFSDFIEGKKPFIDSSILNTSLNNDFRIPCGHLRTPGQISRKKQLQNDLEQDMERKKACSLIKKSMRGSRAQQLLAAVEGSRSEGSANKRRRRMEVSPTRYDSNSTSCRRSSFGSVMRPVLKDQLIIDAYILKRTGYVVVVVIYLEATLQFSPESSSVFEHLTDAFCFSDEQHYVIFEEDGGVSPSSC